MQGVLQLITAPDATKRIVTVAQAKRWARVEIVDDDETLEDVLAACVASIDGRDGWLARALLTQTWDYLLDGFPAVIWMPLAPVASITHVKYLDTTGVEQTLDASMYRTDLVTLPPRICPANGQVWPSTYNVSNAVTVRAVYGYGAEGTDVPAPIRLALRIMAAHFFEHREPVLTGTIAEELPLHLRQMLVTYRMRPIA